MITLLHRFYNGLKLFGFHNLCGCRSFILSSCYYNRYNCIYVTSHVYSSIISSRTCWNCKRLLKDLDFFCECGKVQPVNTNWSYFEVLGYSNPQPIIDVADLSDRMRQSQKLLHPDKFSGKSPYEKKLALDASAFINKAYSCLQKPVERYEYILRLHGMSTDNLDLRKSGDLDFLSEVMDKREKVEEVVHTISDFKSSKKSISELSNSINELVVDLRQWLSDEEKSVIALIKKSDWSCALISFSRFKYILKIFEELREHELAWRQLGINVTMTY
ncbi:Co-chaperone protein HscB like [Schistosoma japonicum]|nr:Co-chaperone protein HscB like [Schistosoma japonicum]